MAPDRGRSEARQGERRFQPGGATAPGSFEPKLVSKRQTRLAGLDDRILGLYAGDAVAAFDEGWALATR